MTIYITQGRYPREAVQGMVANPEDRAVPVAALAKAAGGKLIEYYVTYGEYDFLVIIESGKSETDMLGALMAAAATGGVTDLKTTVAMTSKQAIKGMKAAKKLQKGFKAAGQ
ncbi:MAG: GYD domain-containing protein [Gammaproteobacteria bacterium]|nr:GYD domain-containing protein [Gammaproteobacteria bacterium]